MKKVKPHFRHEANIVDELTGSAFARVAFRDVRGKRGSVDMLRSSFLDLSALKRTLADANAAFGDDEKSLADDLRRLQKSEPQQLYRHAPIVGWGPDRKYFVVANDVISASAEASQLLPPRTIVRGTHAHPASRGTLASWQEKVAAPFRYSSAGIIVLSIPCAAPLLSILRFPTIGLNLYGSSKVSKSALLSAAYSFQARAVILPRFDSTLAGRVDLAREHNDMMLPLDEAGLFSGPPAAFAQFARAGIFALSARQDKRRHHSFPQAANLEFSTIWVSSAEHSLTEYARKAGVTRDAGELARCRDIAAAPDNETLFDFIPAHVSRGKRQSWIERTVARMPEAIAENYGVAMPHYVRYLVEDPEATATRAKEHYQHFMALTRSYGPSSAEAHAIKSLAVLYAGAMLGKEAGVLPFSCEAIQRAFLVHVRQIYKPGDSPIDRAKTLLGSVVKQLPDVASCARRELGTLDGYRRVSQGETEITVKSKSFSDWFRDEPSLRGAAIDWLRQTRRLQEVKSRLLPRPAEGTRMWPDGSTVRCIRFTMRPRRSR